MKKSHSHQNKIDSWPNSAQREIARTQESSNCITTSTYVLSITQILKSSNRDSWIPLNYRGISLISCVTKIYTNVLNSRILDMLDDEELIVDEQNGFCSDRSCQYPIFVLDSVIRNRLAHDMPTSTTFIGLQKAFDYVNGDFLMNKILAYDIHFNVFSAIKSLYINTEACVKLPGGLFTNWFPTSCGVKRGDNLSPTLFPAFINNLATGIKKLNAGIDTSYGTVSTLFNADDIRHHTIIQAAFVCLCVCSLSPPRSFDGSSPNLVGVCRWTSHLPLRGSFPKRSTGWRVNGSLSLSTILYMRQPHATQLPKAPFALLLLRV